MAKSNNTNSFFLEYLVKRDSKVVEVTKVYFDKYVHKTTFLILFGTSMEFLPISLIFKKDHPEAVGMVTLALMLSRV